MKREEGRDVDFQGLERRGSWMEELRFGPERLSWKMSTSLREN